MSFVFKKVNEKRREASLSPPLRCCHLKKNDGEQYGFNLKSKNKDECHFIGKVDEKTPAAKSGLKAGDQIISINHHSVENFEFEKGCSVAVGVVTGVIDDVDEEEAEDDDGE